MCKNKIQFQQGLSLQGFLSQFGSEDQCRDALVRRRWPQGFVLPIVWSHKVLPVEN